MFVIVLGGLKKKKKEKKKKRKLDIRWKKTVGLFLLCVQIVYYLATEINREI